MVHKPFCRAEAQPASAATEERALTDRVSASVLFPPATISTEEEWIDDEKYIQDILKAADAQASGAAHSDDEDDDDIDDEDDEKAEEAPQELVTPGAAAALERTEEEERVKEYQRFAVDAEFLKFQRRISFHPTQVLRYARLEGDAPEPLWVAPTEQPGPLDIPPCPCCGTPRSFEFQLMPQMLLHMDVDDTAVESVDFGTLLVYSCPETCETQTPYAKEVVWRQNFSRHGMAMELDAQRANYGKGEQA